MKINSAIFCFFFFLNFIRADEGMWLPILLNELNIQEMQAMGFRLTAEDIYSVNTGSMKDGVVLFGGGCTGNVISNAGLVLTNHHCGSGSITRLSTVENNYLKNGYWASPDKTSEIPCPGLSVTFIISIHDVTQQIVSYTDTATSEKSRIQIVQNRIALIEKEAVAGTHYQAQIKPFYYGNAYYMFITEKFTDIRLVGTPPDALGNFGDETDNWMWPRHTADFSLFRIYAGKDNKPSDYNPENIPFTPRYHFQISLDGVKENDFTMVYGFPGTTQQFLIPEAVDLQVNKLNELRIGARDIRIDVMNKYMQNNDTITLKYNKKKNDLANAYKKWQGETAGIRLTDGLQKKINQEITYLDWAQKTNSAYMENYNSMENTYSHIESLSEIITLNRESLFGIEAISLARRFDKLAKLLESDTASAATIEKEVENLKALSIGFFSNYYQPIDKEIFAGCMQYIFQNLNSEQLADYLESEAERYIFNYQKWANEIFIQSAFTTKKGVADLLEFIKPENKKILLNDPMFKLARAINIFDDSILVIYNNAQTALNGQMRIYVASLMEMQPEKRFYPDANLTLRVMYGNVKGYYPRNAVTYHFQSTSAGLLEKYYTGTVDYSLPDKMVQLLTEKDFGKYGDDTGELPLAFVATNHTSGGASGSPVINADGALIGINFDRVWEGTMSDIIYDITRCRNISVDIRYILFIIDKYGEASHLIDELTLLESKY